MKLRTIIHSLRAFRKYHRGCGLSISVLLFISALTGVLLSWKKDIELLQPSTKKGISKDLSSWKTVEELSGIAKTHFVKTFPHIAENKIDRIDIRPSKGIAKILFKNGYWELQIDGTTGEVLSVARRHSDWIEALHDGSIISDLFKLVSMNTLGIGLLIMIFTGLWLWYGPKQYRKLRRRKH